jgi:hypothetical protein
MHIHQAIEAAVEKIQFMASSHEKAAKALSPLLEEDLSKFSSSELLENRLKHKIKPIELNGLVAGVDSGFVGKNFSAIDLILIRAMGVVFEFKQGKMVKSIPFPNLFKFPEPYILTDALEKDEFNCAKSLYRLREEIRLTKESIEKFQVQYSFIDGSILPQHADKPRNASKITHLYHEVLNEFQALYQAAEDNHCNLIASVEDSRGTRFRTLLQREILTKKPLLSPEKLDRFFDPPLLDSLLKKGERSLAFSYASRAEKHPIMNDLDEKWAKKIHVFYLKPSDFDRPLRIEFLANGKKLSEQTEEIASVAFALSSLHKEYAYPSVLIEADLRAGLKPEEINIVFDRLADKAGRHLILRRRDKRPF